MENWKKFLAEEEAKHSSYARAMSENEKYILIAVWYENFVKGKKFNPATVRIYQMEEETRTGKIKTKQESDFSALYKGDNAYYTTLSDLTSARNSECSTSPGQEEFCSHRVLLDSMRATLGKHNRSAFQDLHQAVIMSIRYAGGDPKINPRAAKLQKRLITQGKKINISWLNKIEAITKIISTSGTDKSGKDYAAEKAEDEIKDTYSDPRITSAN